MKNAISLRFPIRDKLPPPFPPLPFQTSHGSIVPRQTIKSEWISRARSNLDPLRNLLFHLVPIRPDSEKYFPAPRFQFPRNVTKLSRGRIARKWGGREGKRGIRTYNRVKIRSTSKFRRRSSGVMESNRELDPCKARFSMRSIKRGPRRRMKAPCQSGQSPPAIHGEVNVFSAN